MIEVTNIVPAKGSADVDVNQDIEIKITADFELDPRNVSFTLNDIEIIPDIFSVYQGASVYELIITLYARRRIKYGSGKRYGQEGLRYGMRDIHPSLFEYGSYYVCKFTVWGENNSQETEELNDSTSFTVEEGVFYNDNKKEYFYSEETQGMANYFPDWSKTRYDKYSNAQQLLNPIGQRLEDIQKISSNDHLNNFIQTANLNQLSIMHKVELDKDLEIKSNLNEDGSIFYVQPEINAVQGITRFDLFATQENDINSFYHNSLPTRISSTRDVLSSNLIYGPEIAVEKIQEINHVLERAGSVVITASGVNSSVFEITGKTIVITRCRLIGKNIADNEQYEDILIYNQRPTVTKKVWTEISSIQFSNLQGQQITYDIKYFQDPFTPVVDTKQTTSYDDQKEAILWTGEKRNNGTILKKNVTEGENVISVLRNAGRITEIQELEILDIDNQTRLDLIDIAVDTFTDKIYGIDDGYLYIFDKRESYPERLKEISGENGSADFLIELDTDELGLDEIGEKEISLKCVHKKPDKTILRYRLRIKAPDGSELFAKEDGTYTTDKTKSTIIVKQTDVTLEDRQFFFTVDQIGDYILDLETVYSNGETSRHMQLVRILETSSCVKYKLARILGDEIPVLLVIDSDHVLKILTDSNGLYSIRLANDSVLIDYDKKVLYLTEDYSEVTVG